MGLFFGNASAKVGDTGVYGLVAELKAAHGILGDEAKRRAFDRDGAFGRGEIDAERNPAPEALAKDLGLAPTFRTWGPWRREGDNTYVTSALTLSVTGLMVAVAIVAASPLIMRTLMPQMQIDANSGDGAPATKPHQTPAVQSETRLVLQQSASYFAADSIPLAIRVDGKADGMALEISDLPSGATISSGRPLGTGLWRILATDIGNAVIHLPPGFSGAIDPVIELRLIDDTVVDHGSLHLEWLPKPTKVPDPTESAGAMAASQSSAERALTTAVPADRNAIHHAVKPQLDHERIELLIERSQELISEGDVGAARILLQRAAEAGDAHATLTLGGTYDPVILAKLQVHGVAANVSTARDWYKRASEFGSREAQERLNLLTAALTPIESAGGTFLSDNDLHKVVPIPIAKPKRHVRPPT
jgi:hypothetical protein